MTIKSLSMERREATIVLDTSELVKLCNVLCSIPENQKNDLYYKLRSDLMLARDLTQYGHIDSFCLGKIIECRSRIGQGEA